MAEEDPSPPGDTVPILNINDIVKGAEHPDVILREIFIKIMEITGAEPSPKRIVKLLRSFIEMINYMIENKTLSNFGLYVEGFIRRHNLTLPVDYREGVSRLNVSDGPEPNTAVLTIQNRDRRGHLVDNLPLVLFQSIGFQELVKILTSTNKLVAHNEIRRIVDNLQHPGQSSPPLVYSPLESEFPLLASPVLLVDSRSLEPPRQQRPRLVEVSEELPERPWIPFGRAPVGKGPSLSFDEVESKRNQDIDDSEMGSILTMFDYENINELYDDVRDLGIEVMRHEGDDDLVADNGTARAFANGARAAVKLAHRFLLHVERFGAGARDEMLADEMSKLIGYKVGSGGITFVSLLVIYFIWRGLILNQHQDYLLPRDIFRIHFDFVSNNDTQPPSNTTVPYDINLFSSMVENQSIHEARTLIIMILRDIFGRLHWSVQKSFNEHQVYWYHGSGTDANANLFNKLVVKLQGIGILHRSRALRTGPPTKRTRRTSDNLLDETPPSDVGGFIMPFFPKYIGAGNYFWELYFGRDKSTSRVLDFYKPEKEYTIMIPDKNLQGERLEGCLIRACRCECDRKVCEYCHCQDDKQYPSIHISQVAEVCKDVPAIIIAINIFPKAVRKTKDFQVLMFNPNYFTDQEHARVIMINVPNYRTASAHCCLMLPPDLGYSRSPWQQFVDRSFFNSFLHKCCKSKDNVCPICGKLYPKELMKAHFKYHNSGLFCLECGIVFNSASELDIHREFHCRHLGIGAEFIFEDKIKGYQEKKEKTRAIIYADLESAIEEDGTHKTILCGFVERDEKKVYVYETIWNLFTYAAKRPEEEVLVYFHNGEGYDFHFVLLELGKISTDYVKEITVTADSGEKLRYFEVKFKPPGCEAKVIKFRDSFAFVQQSLEKWVKSTKDSGYDFPCFKATFRDPKKQELVLQKNPFPYNAIKKAEDLNQPIDILDFWFVQPNNTELFCDKYTAEELNDIYYKWFIPARRLFKWTTVDSYYRTYLKCDVSQLCDVMEHFADQVKAEFDGLDIHNYYGTPSLTWAAWLRQNTFTLDPIAEENFDIIIGSIRGGQTGAMTRYYDCIARNEDKGSFCCDLDCNSLYATVMLEFGYPCHDWKTVQEHIPLPQLETWLAGLHDNGRSGFIECDLEVPDDPRLYSYVPVASRRRITGVYNYRTMQEYATATGENVDHFIFSGLANVIGKHSHYCCHTELMQFYLKHRFVEVTRIYKIIHAKNEPVFREYVDHNLKQRTLYKSDPIKNLLYKLMNNSLYGKTYEDVTKRMDMAVVRKDKIDDIPEETIKRTILQLDKWTIIEKNKREFTIDKPIYLGACITEFSKLWMYKFFYEDIRSKFPDAQVMYTDTDALTIKFPTGVSSFRELADKLNTPERQIIDTSNWQDVADLPEIHTRRNTEPGLFKSETGDARIMRMCALRAKTYIMECSDGSRKMSVKGCPMKEKSKLTLLDFYQVMMGQVAQKMIEYDAIVSKYHIVKSTQLTRVVLSGDDRKRYICDDKIHTLPLFSQGHKDALALPFY